MAHVFKLWLACLVQYLQMSLFRSSPAYLPYNPLTLLLTLVAYTLVGMVLLSEQRGVPSIVAQILLETAILYLICYVVLRLGNKQERIFQTLSALLGVNLVISFFSIPIYQMLPPPTPDEVDPLTLKVTLLILLWNLSAISLIFKRAFDINTLIAGFIAINYFLLYEFVFVYIMQPGL